MTEETIFAEAVGLGDPNARAAFLRNACGRDADQLGRVEALLRAHDATGDFLRPAALGTTTARPAGPATGHRPAAAPRPAGAAAPGRAPSGAATGGALIGPYKLLQRIGEGGFGTVWLAEQREPVRRKVALKINQALG